MIFSISNWLTDQLLKSDKFKEYLETKLKEYPRKDEVGAMFAPSFKELESRILTEEELMARIRGYCLANSAPVPPATNVSPSAAFTYDCDGLTCTFDASTSDDPDGSIVTYAWDFGDSNFDNGVTTEHTYASADTYTVTLTVTDNAAATDEDAQNVVVTEVQATISLVVAPDAGRKETNTPTDPAVGNTYSDQDYDVAGLTHRRVTNVSNGSTDYRKTTYARRPMFNADHSMALVEGPVSGSGVYMHLINPNTGAVIESPVYIGPNSSRQYHRTEPVWDYNNPNYLYALAFDPEASAPGSANQWRVARYDMSNIDANGVPARTIMINLLDVNVSVPGYTTASSVVDLFSGIGDTDGMMFTRYEGRPSAVTVDAGLTWAGAPRYWAWQIHNNNGSSGTGSSIGAIVYDLQTNTIIGRLDYSGIGTTDHVCMSHNGDYVEIAWTNNCAGGAGDRYSGPGDTECGAMIYTNDFSSAVGVYRSSPHGDFARDQNGDDVYVFANSDYGFIQYIDCSTGTIENLFEQGFGGDQHISGVGQVNGYIVWDYYDSGSASDSDTLDKIYLTEIVPDDGTALPTNPGAANELATTWILGHNMHYYTGSDTSAPNAVGSYDLSRVAWGSNWMVQSHGSGSMAGMDTYVVEIDLDTYDLP